MFGSRSGVGALALLLGMAASALAEPPSRVTPKHEPKISREQARDTALARVPGRVIHEELEHERRRWIYSFEIKTERPGVQEVNIDADTGAVVSVEHEKD